MSEPSKTPPTSKDVRPGPGRKRSEASRLAILSATRELIGELGYERLSIGGIASRAGVGKDTIYRWWPSKGMVVADAVLEEAQPFYLAPPARGGSVDQDVRAWVHALARDFVDPVRAGRIRAVTSAASEDPATAERLYERFTQVQRTGLIDRLRLAAEAGEVRPDADFGAVVDAILGSLMYWVTARRADLSIASVDSLLDVLLRGLRVAPESEPADGRKA
ncbi:TetR/AcrR family transcriptional regulator [Streptacidiphilus sp. N1-10]|uniref:TetR/AcrR family transcriptional regulator n=1 Tax=Streptacidiphilus jeojiensis TaxID=3229225 RepID=A0ABV6XPB4_9ACTN